jgi:hypothetical protein
LILKSVRPTARRIRIEIRQLPAEMRIVFRMRFGFECPDFVPESPWDALRSIFIGSLCKS